MCDNKLEISECYRGGVLVKMNWILQSVTGWRVCDNQLDITEC